MGSTQVGTFMDNSQNVQILCALSDLICQMLLGPYDAPYGQFGCRADWSSSMFSLQVIFKHNSRICECLPLRRRFHEKGSSGSWFSQHMTTMPILRFDRWCLYTEDLLERKSSNCGSGLPHGSFWYVNDTKWTSESSLLNLGGRKIMVVLVSRVHLYLRYILGVCASTCKMPTVKMY